MDTVPTILYVSMATYLSSSRCLPTLLLAELTPEQAALRHRLELRVERALYRAAVVFPSVHDHHSESSAHHYLDRAWQNEQKVERAWGEVEIALQELRDRQLYRSTHQSFDHYLRERFGSFVQEQSPVIALES